GIGIEKHLLPKLFRIDEKTRTYGTAHEKGTGLGLILCRELIEKNHGKIEVESEPEKGSKFYFTLPAAL
ncbi:MAG: ATP-binding protein, partial [Bacteroidota bacterium]